VPAAAEAAEAAARRKRAEGWDGTSTECQIKKGMCGDIGRAPLVLIVGLWRHCSYFIRTPSDFSYFTLSGSRTKVKMAVGGWVLVLVLVLVLVMVLVLVLVISLHLELWLEES